MKKRALITIIGRQDYNGDKDKIEMKTIGSFDEDNDSYIISYNEELEHSTTPIKAKIKIAKDESQVEMVKSGPYSSYLVIERSKRHLCNYGSEYGEMLMGIFGREIENSYEEKESNFKFSYDIDVNGAISSQNDVSINIKINEQ